MRKIKYLVVHCTATLQNATVEGIKNYWKNNLKWKSPGYHIIVKPDGECVRLAPDSQICNGVAGYNSESIHISYIGGIDAKGKSVDNRTPEQKKSIFELLHQLKKLYPNTTIQGHRDFPKVAKDCPCFDAKKEYNDCIK